MIKNVFHNLLLNIYKISIYIKLKAKKFVKLLVEFSQLNYYLLEKKRYIKKDFIIDNKKI